MVCPYSIQVIRHNFTFTVPETRHDLSTWWCHLCLLWWGRRGLHCKEHIFCSGSKWSIHVSSIVIMFWRNMCHRILFVREFCRNQSSASFAHCQKVRYPQLTNIIHDYWDDLRESVQLTWVTPVSLESCLAVIEPVSLLCYSDIIFS